MEPLQVSIQKAATMLDYHERTIRRLIQSGELPAVGSGKLLRIPMTGIRAYQERHARNAYAEATSERGRDAD